MVNCPFFEMDSITRSWRRSRRLPVERRRLEIQNYWSSQTGLVPRPDGESRLRGGFSGLLGGYANHWFSVHTPSEPRNPTNVRKGSGAAVSSI